MIEDREAYYRLLQLSVRATDERDMLSNRILDLIETGEKVRRLPTPSPKNLRAWDAAVKAARAAVALIPSA
jgi:hypothetical protein